MFGRAMVLGKKERQRYFPVAGDLNARAQSNNSFNASGISLILIENFAVPQMLPAALIRALDSY
jgi:hypothetical protein